MSTVSTVNTVSTRIDGSRPAAVAVLSIDNPPVNAMSMAVRAGLRDAVLAASAEEGVQAIVIIGANG